MAASFRQPAHPVLKACADRVFALLELKLGVNRKVAAAFFLFMHCMWTGEVHRAQRLVAMITPLLADPDLTARYRALWHYRLGFDYWLNAEYKQAAEALATGREIAHSHGLPIVPLLCAFQVYVGASTGDLATVERVVADIEAALASSGPAYYFVAHTARGTLAMLRGDVVGALRERRRAVELIDRIGVVYSRGIYRHHLAQLLALSGQLDEASRVAGEARELMKGAGYVHDEAVLQLVEAYVELGRNNTIECHRLLRQALSIGRQTGYYTYMYPHGQALMPRLFEEALRAGIEVDYVRSAIRKCGLVPELPTVEGWPWPVEIYCLGRFEIHVGGAPMAPGGKRPLVPMSLVMALVALGGEDVGVETLGALLWPDAEGDAAEKALDITLHRLRKLLGDDATVLRQHNGISLNPRLCWVDVWAFEQTVATADPLELGVTQQQPPASAARLLGLYRGPFLAHQCDEPWALQARTRLQQQFLRSIRAIGQRLEANRQWDEAATLYRRALEIENLAEELYRRLILCLQARGDCAEALRAYRSCRDMLSVVLGVEPAQETQALYRELLSLPQDPESRRALSPVAARTGKANP